MAIKTVLEEIVTVFTGDSKAYERAVKNVVSTTMQAAAKVEAATNQIANSLSNSVKRVQHQIAAGRDHYTRAMSPGGQPLSFAKIHGGLPFANYTPYTPKVHGPSILPFASGAHVPFASFGGMAGGGVGGGPAKVGMFSSIVASTRNAMTVTGQFFHHFNRGIRRMWYDVRMLGQGFRRWFVMPFVGGLLASEYAFASYEDQISKAMSIFGTGGRGRKQDVFSGILDMSKGTRLTANQLTEQLQRLASAGYSVDDAMKALSITEKFAVASGMEDAAHAAQLLLDVQSALGMRVSNTTQNMANMSKVASLLAVANQEASGEIEDFAKALTNRSAASLRMAGRSAEEGLAILMALHVQGVKAQKAGMQMSILMRDVQSKVLSRPRDWERFLGGNAVYNKSGGLKDITEIIAHLSDKFAGLTQEQKIAELHLLGFTDRSSDAIKMLLGTTDTIGKFKKALEGADKELEIMYGERMGSFLSQLMKTWNWIYKVAVEIGQSLKPEILLLAGALRGLLAAWEGLPSIVRKSVIYLGIGAVVIGAVVGVVAGLAGAIAALVTAWPTLTAALGPLIAGIGSAFAGVGGIMLGWNIGVIAAAAAAIGTLIYMIVGPDGLAAAFNFTWGIVRGLFNFWLSGIGMIVGTIRTLVKVIFTDIRDLPKVLENLSYNFGIALGAAQRLASVFFGWVASKIKRVFTVELLMGVLEGIMGAIKMFNAFFAYIIVGMKNAWKGVLFGGGEGLNNQLKKIVEDFSKAFQEEDLTKGINDVLKDTQKQFRSLTAGTGLDESLNKPLNQAADAAKNLRDETSRPFKIKLSVEPIEGHLLGSAGAFDVVRKHLDEMQSLGYAGAEGTLNKFMGLTSGEVPDSFFSAAGPDSAGEIVGILTEIKNILEDQKTGDKTKSQEIRLRPIRIE